MPSSHPLQRHLSPQLPAATALRLLAASLLPVLAGPAIANGSTHEPIQVAAPAQGAAAPAPKASPAAETVLVIEDEAVRIEETRLRGQTVRVHVQSKIAGVKGYEIIVNPGRDPAQLRGATGQHAWSLFRF